MLEFDVYNGTCGGIVGMVVAPIEFTELGPIELKALGDALFEIGQLADGDSGRTCKGHWLVVVATGHA